MPFSAIFFSIKFLNIYLKNIYFTYFLFEFLLIIMYKKGNIKIFKKNTPKPLDSLRDMPYMRQITSAANRIINKKSCYIMI